MNRFKLAAVAALLMGVADPAMAQPDPNNAPLKASSILTPSGTAGTAGILAANAVEGMPGGPAAYGNNGYGFGWVCSTAGTGTITLGQDKSVVPFYFATNNGGIATAAISVIDAEPGTAAGCTFRVFY